MPRTMTPPGTIQHLAIDLVNARDAAAILGVTPRTVRRLHEEQKLRPIVPAHEALYLRADLELLALQRATDPMLAHRAREATALGLEQADAA